MNFQYYIGGAIVFIIWTISQLVIRYNKNKEYGINFINKILTETLDLLANRKTIYDTSCRAKTKEEIKMSIEDYETLYHDLLIKDYNILSKNFYIMERCCSKNIKTFLQKTHQSSRGHLPQPMFWLTDHNIEELIFLIKLELKLVSVIDKIKVKIRIWLFPQYIQQK